MAARTDPSRRCEWGNDPVLTTYHDEEWGVPEHRDRTHFELLSLEGAQAGLSWKTVLRKREGYRRAFKNFDAKRVAKFGEDNLDQLVLDESLIRNRAKLASVITNAQAFLAVQNEFDTFDNYVWQFVDKKPIVHRFKNLSELPPRSQEGDALSKDLKKRGFRFVGPTICYSYLQATGLVMDHVVTCFRYQELG